MTEQFAAGFEVYAISQMKLYLRLCHDRIAWFYFVRIEIFIQNCAKADQMNGLEGSADCVNCAAADAMPWRMSALRPLWSRPDKAKGARKLPSRSWLSLLTWLAPQALLFCVSIITAELAKLSLLSRLFQEVASSFR